MSGTLTHSPIDIMRGLLVAMGLGSGVANPQVNPWPVHAFDVPDKPDNVITTQGGESTDDGRTAFDGERQEHHGVTIRVRGTTDDVAYAKAKAIATALDTEALDETVTIQGAQYLVHSVSLRDDPVGLGREIPTSARSVYQLDATLTVRQL